MHASIYHRKWRLVLGVARVIGFMDFWQTISAFKWLGSHPPVEMKPSVWVPCRWWSFAFISLSLTSNFDSADGFGFANGRLYIYLTFDNLKFDSMPFRISFESCGKILRNYVKIVKNFIHPNYWHLARICLKHGSYYMDAFAPTDSNVCWLPTRCSAVCRSVHYWERFSTK